MRENFRIYVQISGPNSNFRTFQDKFQNFKNFRTTPRPAWFITSHLDQLSLPSLLSRKIEYQPVWMFDSIQQLQLCSSEISSHEDLYTAL